jgi:ribosomal protein S18 acetylase RimI-like enzyme
MLNIKIEPLNKKDISQLAMIASENFSGMKQNATLWIASNFKAFPRARYFCAKTEKTVVAYILWLEKGGFREKAVFELEQIAVSQKWQGKGIGSRLIIASLKEIEKCLRKEKRKIKIIEVSTGVDNKAQNLYCRTLNAKPEATIKNLFRGDEVIMIARQ